MKQEFWHYFSLVIELIIGLIFGFLGIFFSIFILPALALVRGYTAATTKHKWRVIIYAQIFYAFGVFLGIFILFWLMNSGQDIFAGTSLAQTILDSHKTIQAILGNLLICCVMLLIYFLIAVFGQSLHPHTKK